MLQNKVLFEIFDKNPNSHPENILSQDGLEDYIEDLIWKENPPKCSEKNRANIEMVLNSHPSQQEAIAPLINYEKEKGKGSLRKFVNQKVEIPQFIKDLPEWTEPEF